MKSVTPRVIGCWARGLKRLWRFTAEFVAIVIGIPFSENPIRGLREDTLGTVPFSCSFVLVVSEKLCDFPFLFLAGIPQQSSLDFLFVPLFSVFMFQFPARSNQTRIHQGPDAGKQLPSIVQACRGSPE